MKKWLDNYNDASVSTGPGFVGQGYDTKGRNYSPAWGGQFQWGGFLQPNDIRLPSAVAPPNQGDILSSELARSIGGEGGEPAYLVPSFKGGRRVNEKEEFRKTGEHLGGPFKTWEEAEKFGEMRHQYVEKGQSLPSPLKWWGDMAMGGSIPGSVGFTYARTQGAAPDNGKYAKKTKASAQNGKEMKFYQDGLDWKPKSISKNGKWLDNYSEPIKDDRGQWAHPGKITEINSNLITMDGVDYPVLGVSDAGDVKLMEPGKDYKFKGKKVTEYPMAQDGRNISKELKKEAEEKLKRMNKPKATISQYTPKAGEAERLDKEKLQRIEDSYKLLNRAASSKGAKNLWDAGNFALDVMGTAEGLGAAKNLLKKAPKFNLSKAATTVAEDDAAKVVGNSVITRGPIPAPYKGTTLPYDNIGYKEPATGELAPYLTPEFEAIPYSELPKTVYHGGPNVISDVDAIKVTREGLPIQSATSPTSRGFYTSPYSWMPVEGSPNPFRDVEGLYGKASEVAESYAMGRGDAYIHAGEFVQDPRIVDWKTFSNLDPIKSLNPDFRRLSPEAAKVAEDLGIYGLRDKNEYNILNPQKVFQSFKPAYKNLGKGWEKYNKGGWLNKYK